MNVVAITTLRLHRLRVGSSCATYLSTITSSSPPSSSLRKRRHYTAYAWGTSNKGTIPLPEIIEEGSKAGAGGGSGATDLLNRGTVIDNPREIDVEKAFGSGTGEFYFGLERHYFLYFFVVGGLFEKQIESGGKRKKTCSLRKGES
uniref:Uncharacterized protein n=1 Tax=Ditylum brightwellii TaxID=49249 RepID=A0A7S4R4T7_9STRA|mmetsp:Transcript_29152/g.44083  ORF Transcript_29152/g.44083 Transcript_29152/m.44083 type:complete len:146 (+) Transcript_29152:220-657(+)